MFNNFGQPAYPPQYAPQFQRLQQMEQQYPQFAQQNQPSYPQNPQSYPQPNIGLQGKSVESLDVVKAMDIPLDGSISYFPLTDGSAIITKQLQRDGTSKTIVYKPDVPPETIKKEPKYVTEEDLKKALETEPEEIQELKDEIKDLKRELRDMAEDMKELRKTKDTKRKSDD